MKYETEEILDTKHINLIKNISYKPIFILGLHRSGTSILYKMLGATKKFNTVTAYHILKYDELLYNKINNFEDKAMDDLRNLFKNKSITDRRIDHLPITPDFAQEYVYLLTQKKHQNKITSNNMTLVSNLCKKIQLVEDNNKPIILKNHYDFPNFLFIKKMLPSSKFIFIHRNPLQVISSTMRAWKILLENKNPYTALFSRSYNQIFSNPLLLFIARLYYSSFFPLGIFNILNRSARAANYYLKNIDYLQKKNYISITYESLCRNPNETMNKITDFLNNPSDIDYSKFIKSRNLDLTQQV